MHKLLTFQTNIKMCFLNIKRQKKLFKSIEPCRKIKFCNNIHIIICNQRSLFFICDIAFCSSCIVSSIFLSLFYSRLSLQLIFLYQAYDNTIRAVSGFYLRKTDRFTVAEDSLTVVLINTSVYISQRFSHRNGMTIYFSTIIPNNLR